MKMRKVIKAKPVVEKVHTGPRSVTLHQAWLCKLECGHTVRRRRSTAPERLKCEECAVNEEMGLAWERGRQGVMRRNVW